MGRHRNTATAVAEPEIRADAPALELVAYLQGPESGTPIKLIRQMKNWLEQSENAEATADALYRQLEKVHFKSGTLRKAGKWIWGPTFEPESVVKQAPADELLRLRAENDRLMATNQTLAAEKLGLMHQNSFLREQLDEASRKISFLSIGKSKADLDTVAVGMGPSNQPEE